MFQTIRYHPGPEGSGPEIPPARAELAAIETRIPRQDSIEATPNKDLHQTWREVHSDLYRAFKSIDSPFFSLHGTSRDSLQTILGARQGMFQVATFTDKSKDERRLYELYAAVDYCSAYTQKSTSQRGGILVLDSEIDGINFTGRDQTLIYSGALPMGIVFDSAEEARELARLQGSEGSLGHGYLEIKRKEEFDARFKGVVDCADLESWFQAPETSGPDYISKTILKSRFRIQLLTAKVLGLLTS